MDENGENRLFGSIGKVPRKTRNIYPPLQTGPILNWHGPGIPKVTEESWPKGVESLIFEIDF